MRHAGAGVTASDPRWMDISPLNMSPLFAAGELLAMTCCDRFTVEALFTPQIVPLLRMLLFGDKSGHRLYQIACPEDYVGLPYEELVSKLIPEGQVPVGIFRTPINNSTCDLDAGEMLQSVSHADMPDTTIPYVMTNPKPQTVKLRKADYIFVIGNRDDSATVTKSEALSSYVMVDEQNLQDLAFPQFEDGSPNAHKIIL
jgi:hypothetical protein